MNTTPAPDSPPSPYERTAVPVPAPHLPAPESVPRQTDAARAPRRPGRATVDPLDLLDLLDHPDTRTAAQAAAVENLLRCWVRENDLAAPDDGTLRIALPASGVTLLVPVHHWSRSGWHRFGLPRLAGTPEQAPAVDAVTVAALLARQTAPGTPAADTVHPAPADDPAAAAAAAAAATRTGPGAAASGVWAGAEASGEAGAGHTDSPAGEGTDLVGRVADSVRRTAVFIRDRREHPADPPDHFLAAEQALLLGHPLHPMPKGRDGLSDTEGMLYSPELRGFFPLHWMAVAPSVLASDSAWTERGRPVSAEQLTLRLAGPGLSLPEGFSAVLPLHPWQMREVRSRPGTAALLDAGLLRDLGPHGTPWHPTSSVRTVYRSGAPAMLKLSLGLRITNSRRENLRKELHRGAEVHRLLRGGLSEQWQSVHPGFDIVRDPSWLAVDDRDGDPLPGLDVMIRHNPFTPTDDVGCVAGLVSPRPYARLGTHNPAERGPFMRSRLTEVVTGLAGRTGRPRGAVATEWFLRYLEQVVRPVLWLDSEAGIALEAHQQNTLLVLDADGWPTGGRYRDNQGYYFRESRRAELDRRLPGIGAHSDTFVPDEVTDERFAYYLAINNVFGLIGAFGSQRLADEALLLAAFRRFLGGVITGPARLRTPLPALLLDSPVLRCKANLLTRLHGLDELVGPVDTQSVYVTIANPLHS
ncbi:IucA/IucC family protein [Streptomyces sp. NPDC056738]|uniref:IucA/IucC family protein n=1 Tax=Streptomyces sp. NPDC056738 TaxID=3345933 RepID=UPI0036BF2772